MTRHERIRTQLRELERRKIVTGEGYVQGGMPGLRWIVVPQGHGVRAMTTNEVEWFILGANATLNAGKRYQ